MRPRWPAPRLLPLTMLAMAALFGVKSVGLLRLAAPARAATTPAGVQPAVPPATTAPAAGAEPATRTAEPPVSASELALLQDLRRRNAELDARAAALAGREHVAAAAEMRLGARLDELGGLQTRLESLEAARRTRDEASWQGLVRVYEAMKPKDAAVIFDDLDMPVLLQVMDRMKDRKAAPVLAAMLPERARELTAELAELRSRANRIPDKPVAQAAASPTPTSPASAPAPPTPQ